MTRNTAANLRNIAGVQPNFFDVIGVRPVLGGFTPDDFVGARQLIEPRVVTDRVFRSEFGGDPAAIGRVVLLDPSSGAGYRLVGVMPRGFTFPAERYSVGYLAPYVEERLPRFMLSAVIARLLPDGSADAVAARVLAAVTPKNADRPGTNSSNHPINEVHAALALRRDSAAR